jgi:hypothetical protein
MQGKRFWKNLTESIVTEISVELVELRLDDALSIPSFASGSQKIGDFLGVAL